MKKQIEVGPDGYTLTPGTYRVVVVEGGKMTIVREVSGPVPTRVVVDVGETDGFAHVFLPDVFKNQKVTCILGKDELPEDVNLGYFGLIGGHPSKETMKLMADFIRSRWPEAFKETP